ncbi:MAG TPA: YHS domain-containing protein [Actinomycetota bacterium]|nr:YHS domain-containing protein [Actinomycetota bacterium]
MSTGSRAGGRRAGGGRDGRSPVCGMRLDPDDAAATAEHGGKIYYFCSETCHDAFVSDPDTYV